MSTIAKACAASLGILIATTALATDSGAKQARPPSSYAPRPAGGSHVYGAPIEPPVVGQSTARRNYAHKKSSAASANTRARSPAKAHSKPKVARHSANE